MDHTASGFVILNINGDDIGAAAGQTILEVARENHIFIPTLCHVEGLSPVGSCRMCMVELKRSETLFPACRTVVQDNMEVITDSPRLRRYRKQVLSMIFSERNHVCSICVSNGHCELQEMAEKLHLDHVTFPYRYPEHDIDSTHPYFLHDPNRCILCTRCMRVCSEVEGAHVWYRDGRGIDTDMSSRNLAPWGDVSTCTKCGKCVQVCPTGALIEKGVSTAEMVKEPEFLPYLTKMREGQ
jgi:bidirectional [NiFe] hydrogenase diaphorase subunit